MTNEIDTNHQELDNTRARVRFILRLDYKSLKPIREIFHSLAKIHFSFKYLWIKHL